MIGLFISEAFQCLCFGYISGKKQVDGAKYFVVSHTSFYDVIMNSDRLHITVCHYKVKPFLIVTFKAFCIGLTVTLVKLIFI